jgi:JmjC domain, hydroxylase/Jumonji helical domain
LGAQVLRPQFVRDLDLIEKVWPEHLRPSSTSNLPPVVLPTSSNTPSNITFPKVTLYCLMSVSRSYTDFHIDFGGSSVFYHILRGKKTFLFIDPTPANLRKYEAWCSDPDQSKRFLGDDVRECIRVDLSAGDTMIIPSGWIHAVYTPQDSLVLGGNFLTQLHLGKQLLVAGIENRTRVPKKFRFPFFDIAMWYTAQWYLTRLPTAMSSYEREGITLLADWLWKKAKLRNQQVAKGAEYHRAKVEVPPGMDVLDVAGRFAKWVFKGEGNVPVWFRTEVLKADGSRKRKRTEEVETPVKRTPRRITRKDGTTELITLPVTRLPALTTLFRPVTTYLSVSGTQLHPQTQIIPAQHYQPRLFLPPSLTLHKPYAQTSIINPSTKSFIATIQACRPYIPRRAVLEEIKVEHPVPPFGLNILTAAIDLTQSNPSTQTPPVKTSPRKTSTPRNSSTPGGRKKSSGTPRTPRSRLPTPSSPPRSSAGRKSDPVEARRLQSLLSEEELYELRQRQRRGKAYLFGVGSLRKELDRVGKRY